MRPRIRMKVKGKYRCNTDKVELCSRGSKVMLIVTSRVRV